MTGYIIKRLLLAVPVLLGVVTLVFIVMRVVPGDVARNLAGDSATVAQVQQARHNLGLDKPVLVQYVSYIGKLTRGDLGRSVYSRRSVAQELRNALPRTVVLAVVALTIATLIGVSLGVLAASRPQTVIDYAGMGFAAISLAFPNFVLALVLVYVFAVKFGWLPASGKMDVKHLILPVTTIALRESAVTFRLTRATMLDAMHGDYVRTARAKGLSERLVLMRHALRNALLPIVTLVGLQLGFTLGGAVIIESIFAYPGVGNLIVSSINQRDYAIVQGGVLVLAVFFVVINLTVDLSYSLIDPRVKHG